MKCDALEALLAASGSSLPAAVDLLESQGRPSLLSFLKDTVGVAKLSERQTYANAIGRLRKERSTTLRTTLPPSERSPLAIACVSGNIVMT